jgi:hypothetical protein
LSSCLPVEAWPPVIGTVNPILTASSADTGAREAHAIAGASAVNAKLRERLLTPIRIKRFPLLPRVFFRR